jgi:hypothetical protein
MFEHARDIRELARRFQLQALTATDPFLCCELLELATICEAKARRIDRRGEISDRPSAPPAQRAVILSPAAT